MVWPFSRKPRYDDEWVNEQIEKAESPQRQKFDQKGKYKWLAGGFLGAACLFGTYGAVNVWRWHVFDKYVIKQVEIAANVPSVGNGEAHLTKEPTAGLSMEFALKEARAHLNVSPLQNPAIFWKTPHTDVSVLDDLLQKAVSRTVQIKQFQDCFESGLVKQEYPSWVRTAHERLDPRRFLLHLPEDQRKLLEQVMPTLEELAKSEYGQRIGSEYEALNTVVAGGTRTTGKNVEERHKSLLDTLQKAGGFRSIIRFQADDFKETYARVFVGYLYANMGHIDEAVREFRVAKKIMDEYPDDKNLALLRNTPELSQRTIKGLIDSSIHELEALGKDPAQYSTGWWKRLRYYNQSIGGQENPSIQDMAEAIDDRYWARVFYSGVVALGFLYLAGMYAKRWRKMDLYEVPSTRSGS